MNIIAADIALNEARADHRERLLAQAQHLVLGTLAALQRRLERLDPTFALGGQLEVQTGPAPQVRLTPRLRPHRTPRDLGRSFGGVFECDAVIGGASEEEETGEDDPPH